MPGKNLPLKSFWVAISGAVWVSIVLLACIPNRLPWTPPSLAEEIVFGFVLVTLTTVVWAICFRSQVETRRVSLVAIFTLVTMLAVLFWAFRSFDPLGIYPN